MAYISQQEKKTIANKINPILKSYNLKGTLSVDNNTKLILTIWEGGVNFIGNCNEVMRNNHNSYYRNDTPIKDSMEINEYYYKEHFSGVALEVLSKLLPAMKTDDWHDDSDIMSDYHNISYYVSLKIGNWNKPYKLTKQQENNTMNATINAFTNYSNIELADTVMAFSNEVKRLISISETVEPDIDVMDNIQYVVNQLSEEINSRV